MKQDMLARLQVPLGFLIASVGDGMVRHQDEPQIFHKTVAYLHFDRNTNEQGRNTNCFVIPALEIFPPKAEKYVERCTFFFGSWNHSVTLQRRNDAVKVKFFFKAS